MRFMELPPRARLQPIDMSVTPSACASIPSVRWWWLLWLIVMQAGCLHELSQTCAGGAVCPPGLLCVDTANTTAAGQTCATSDCGNGRPDFGEACDDGNNRSRDGCPADCTEPCGDSVIDPGETCDDGNTTDGDGCAADCLSFDGLFLVSPPHVSLAATEGDDLPAPVTVSVDLQYRGDRVRWGYMQGIPQPTWLSIEDGPTTATTAELTLRATDTLVVGKRSTTVRLSISHQSSSDVDVFDLPVDYSVARSDLAIEAEPATLALVAKVDDLVRPSQTLSVMFNGVNLSVVSAPSWVTVTPAPLTSPAIFTVSANSTSFPAGTTMSGDIVFGTTRGVIERTAHVHLDYGIEAPPLLQIQAAPSSLFFTAISGDVIPPSQALTVTFSGTNVTVISMPTWLSVSSSGPVGQSASFDVAVNTTAFGAGTSLLGDIVFRTTRGTSQENTAHPGFRWVAG